MNAQRSCTFHRPLTYHYHPCSFSKRQSRHNLVHQKLENKTSAQNNELPLNTEELKKKVKIIINKRVLLWIMRMNICNWKFTRRIKYPSWMTVMGKTRDHNICSGPLDRTACLRGAPASFRTGSSYEWLRRTSSNTRTKMSTVPPCNQQLEE